jgi:2-iminobutanoate/2-iminopropanoate deaminase
MCRGRWPRWPGARQRRPTPSTPARSVVTSAGSVGRTPVHHPEPGRSTIKVIIDVRPGPIVDRTVPSRRLPAGGHGTRKRRTMSRQAVRTEQAAAALGPYSQAIVAGGFVFCSGTAGIDPVTGAVPDGIEAQTEQALRNLAAVLDAAGSSMDHIVKTTIFYVDVEDFARINEVYARHMPDPAPARSAPANVRLPHGLLISIDAIAVLPAGGAGGGRDRRS